MKRSVEVSFVSHVCQHGSWTDGRCAWSSLPVLSRCFGSSGWLVKVEFLVRHSRLRKRKKGVINGQEIAVDRSVGSFVPSRSLVLFAFQGSQPEGNNGGGCSLG